MSAFFAVLAILLLALGQFQRFTLTPNIAFYGHDVAVAIFLLVVTFSQRQKISVHISHLWRRWQKNRALLITIFLGLILTIMAWFFNLTSIAPILYALRLVAYTIFIYYLFTLKILTARQLKFTLFTSIIIFLTAGFAQYFIFPDAYWLKFLGWDDHYHRLFSTLLDPNFAGMIFIFPILYLIAKEKFSFAKIVFLGFLFVVLLLTYSRASYLALAISLLILFWQRLRAKKIKLQKNIRPILILLGVFAVALTIFLARPQTHSDSTNLLRTNSIFIRAQMALTQIQAFRVPDLLIGRGVFVALPNSASRSIATNFTVITAAFPDNFFLLLISFFGIPFTILLIFWLIKILIFTAQQNFTIFLLLIAVLIHSQFNNTFFQPFVYLYGALFICLLNSRRTSVRSER